MTTKYMKNKIEIIDWAGNILFSGSYKSKEVDKIIQVNKCNCNNELNDGDLCEECDHTGYAGEIEILWVDTNDTRNVYEYVNY